MTDTSRGGRAARRILAALILTAAVSTLAIPAASATVTARAAGAVDTGVPDSAVLRAAASRVIDAGATGVVVRVDDGRRVTRFAVGAAQLRPRRELAPDDEFRVGSNTKMFVATVALQLVAEHRLGLADSVQRWLPGLLPDGDRITVRMLLNHTSGVFDYTEDEAFNAIFYRYLDRMDHRFTPRELVGFATTHPAVFAPGTDWAYSNTNYVVAGLILEKVTGQPVGDLIDRRIVRPLRLRHTYLQASAAFHGRAAHGYLPPELTGAGNVDTTARADGYAAWAAGALVSTADDLTRFDTALLAGRLLPPAQLRELTTLVPASADRVLGQGSRYGLGLISVDVPAGRLWGHGGSIPGYTTFSFTDEHGRRSMQVLVPTEATERIGSAISELLVAASYAMFGQPARSVPGTAWNATGAVSSTIRLEAR